MAGIRFEEVYSIQVFSWFLALWVTRLKSRYLPVLKTRDGVLMDSSDILKYIDNISKNGHSFYPREKRDLEEVRRLEDYFDDIFGPATRLWCYCQLFRHKKIVMKYNCYRVPMYQKILMPIVFPCLVAIGKRVLTINEQSYQESITLIDETLEMVSDIISDGREFLVGNKLSAADIAFASMIAPLIMPNGYGIPIPDKDEFDDEARVSMYRYADHPAGQFALNLYKNYRRRG